MTKNDVAILVQILVLVGLYLTSLYSYPLFHNLVEIYIVVIAGSIFVLAWNSRRYSDNSFLLLLGISYLFVGIIELIHTLAYKGIGIFQGFDANLLIQLWIAARYMEGFSLLTAPLFIRRRLNQKLAFAIYVVATFFLLNLIFYWNIFPDCFIEGSGLTPFKKISEYVIMLTLSISIILLLRCRSEFERDVLRMLVASIFLTILAELSFTFYISIYGLSNLIGHFLTLISFYFIYRAIIVTGLTRPFDLLFRNLAQSEAASKRVNEELTGIYWFEKIVPRDRYAYVWETFQDYQQKIGAMPTTFESPILTKAGEERFISWQNNTISAVGAPISTIPFGIDITERVRGEEALHRLNRDLQERVARYRAIVEAFDGLIYTCPRVIALSS